MCRGIVLGVVKTTAWSRDELVIALVIIEIRASFSRRNERNEPPQISPDNTLINQFVITTAANYPDRNARCNVASDNAFVIAAVQINSDLLRLVRRNRVRPGLPASFAW